MLTEKGNINWVSTLASIAIDKNQLELAKHILAFNKPELPDNVIKA